MAHYTITRVRMVLVHLGLAVLLLGSGFDIVVGREHWPFSNYPMYSGLEDDTTVTRLRFYAIPQAAATPSFPLVDLAYIQPFDGARLNTALKRMQRQPNGDTLLRQAARDVLQRYELLRQAGRHNGPVLRGLALYDVEWDIDPHLRNRAQPDRRVLLFEIPSE